MGQIETFTPFFVHTPISQNRRLTFCSQSFNREKEIHCKYVTSLKMVIREDTQNKWAIIEITSDSLPTRVQKEIPLPKVCFKKIYVLIICSISSLSVKKTTFETWLNLVNRMHFQITQKIRFLKDTHFPVITHCSFAVRLSYISKV